MEPEANKWLREHAMDCIVWAQRLTVADSSGTLTTHISEGDGLAGEDFQRILSVSITEEDLPSSSQPDCTEEESETDHVSPQNEGSTTDDSSDEGDLMKLGREIETAEPDGIRQKAAVYATEKRRSASKGPEMIRKDQAGSSSCGVSKTSRELGSSWRITGRSPDHRSRLSIATHP